MADLFDRYGVTASPAAPNAGGDLFDRYAAVPSSGGVQDWEPTIPEPTVMDRVNRGVNWLGTRATKAATGIAGLPRAYADVERMAGEAVFGSGRYMPSPVAAATRFLPSSQQMNDVVFNQLGVPEVNASGKGGKILDAATEAALGTVVMPGSLLRNVIPAAVGGASQEVAGQLTEGTKYEPAARVVAGITAGGLSAAAQNALGNVGQAAKNIRPNVDKTAAKIVGRALERDQMTGEMLGKRQADLGPGAMLVEAGGPNVRGTMRGSIAAPGAARTEAQNAFDLRMEGSNARTTAALDSAITPNNSLALTVDDLAAARAAAARPKYEEAGIPRQVRKIEGDRFDVKPDYEPNAIVRRDPTGMPIVDDKPYLITPPAPRYNSPTFETPQIRFLIENSPDVRTAIGAARKLPQFKDLPDNSMVMLDKAYKHLSGMEQEAIRAGNNTRAFDLKNLRTQFQDALTEANPKYQEALDAFAGPSKLIEASQKGKEWFTKNTDPKMAAKEFQAMPPGEKEAAMVGVRDWARTLIGRSDRGIAAERVWNGGDNRERLKQILGDEGFATLKKAMETERNAIRTSRDINVGSRTTPMALEAADNAGNPLAIAQDVASGRFGSAATQAIGNVLARVGQGRTEAVNARIAKMLTSTDPKEVGLVNALLEQARLQEIARTQGRRNALAIGGVSAPTVNALSVERR